MYKNIYKYDDMKRSEHMAVRNTAGWYLWTHELMEVRGADAAAFLDYVCANPIANLAVGRERYTTMLDESAEIIDDVVVFRMAEELFWYQYMHFRQVLLQLLCKRPHGLLPLLRQHLQSPRELRCFHR